MSAATPSVPYVAPWQTQFDRYSTQIYQWPSTAANELSITVAANQWWRIVYAFAAVGSSSTAGDRLIQFMVKDTSNAQVFIVATTAAMPASSNYDCIFAPGLTSYVGTTTFGAHSAVTAIPDMLWRPGYTFELLVGNFQSGDSFLGITPYVAVEIYAQNEQTGALAPAPTVPLAV